MVGATKFALKPAMIKSIFEEGDVISVDVNTSRSGYYIPITFGGGFTDFSGVSKRRTYTYYLLPSDYMFEHSEKSDEKGLQAISSAIKGLSDKDKKKIQAMCAEDLKEFVKKCLEE